MFQMASKVGTSGRAEELTGCMAMARMILLRSYGLAWHDWVFWDLASHGVLLMCWVFYERKITRRYEDTKARTEYHVL